MDAPSASGPEAASVPVAPPLPALGLPPEALRSLRSAFAREVAVRLPRLLTAARDGHDAVRGADAPGPLALARTDSTMLAEGCMLLGDAAAARALRRLGELLDERQDRHERLEAASTAALLLGRWAPARGGVDAVGDDQR